MKERNNTGQSILLRLGREKRGRGGKNVKGVLQGSTLDRPGKGNYRLLS